MDFTSPDYLLQGNKKQQQVYRILASHRIFEKLHAFTPILTGTIPIAIDTAKSDLDIICCCNDPAAFVQAVTKTFSGEVDFIISEKSLRGRSTILVQFKLESFNIEIFGQNRPVLEQEAYRHMVVEYNLLKKHGKEFRKKIIQMKDAGIKTEAAFARALGIKGDPYVELLKLPL